MAQDIKDKETALDDSASIYEKRDEETQSGILYHWKQLDGEGKKKYFKEYILPPLAIVVGIALLLIYIAHNIATEGYSEYYTVFSLSPYYMDEKKMTAQTSDLSDRWKDYMDKKDRVTFNDQVSLLDNVGLQTFETYIEKQEMDVIIGTIDELEPYAQYFQSMDVNYPRIYDQLPTESLVTMHYVKEYATTHEDEVREEGEVTCGILVKDTVLADAVKAGGADPDKLIIVLADTKPNYEYTLSRDDDTFVGEDFIKYLFGLE